MKTIIFVDANTKRHSNYKNLIHSKYKSLDAIVFTDAIEALRAIDETPDEIILVVTNVYIDGMDALEFVDRVKRTKTDIFVIADMSNFNNLKAQKLEKTGTKILSLNFDIPEFYYIIESNILKHISIKDPEPVPERVENEPTKTPNIDDDVLNILAKKTGQPFQSVKHTFEKLKSFDETAEACEKAGRVDVLEYVNKILVKQYHGGN